MVSLRGQRRTSRLWTTVFPLQSAYRTETRHSRVPLKVRLVPVETWTSNVHPWVDCAYCLKYVTAATQRRKVSWLSTDPLRRSRHRHALLHILLESGGNCSL